MKNMLSQSCCHSMESPCEPQVKNSKILIIIGGGKSLMSHLTSLAISSLESRESRNVVISKLHNITNQADD